MRAVDAYDRVKDGQNDFFENIPLSSHEQINKIKQPSQPVTRSRLTS